MTVSDVLFDTWAWWEVLHGTPRGAALWKKYGRPSSVRIHSSLLTLAELSVKLTREGRRTRVAGALSVVESSSRVHAVSRSHAERAGPLLAALRARCPDAGLVDALILACAQELGSILISGDAAYSGFRNTRAD